MSSRLMAVTFDAVDPTGLAAFWASVLGRDIVQHRGGILVPGDDTQVGLLFVQVEQAGQSRLHLHLTSSTPDDQQHTIDRVIALGARHIDVGQRPEEGHVVLADPAGYALCVIEPQNKFLAGCGFLGEVACDGSRDVGVFWHHALGWPLVWDDNGETAVQSPHGGTKVSWGGPPIADKIARNSQQFHLVATDLAAEVDRLVGLGATELGERDGVQLADPDGNEFSISGA